jgi:predicted DNA-binding protein
MTIASRNQISHYHEAKSNLQSLVKQTCQVGLGFAVMLLVTAGRPSAFGLSVTVGLGIAFVTWGEVRRLDSNNLSINIKEFIKVLGVRVIIYLGMKYSYLGTKHLTARAGTIVINESQQKSLAEVAKEIQELLDKLSQTYPTTKTTEKMEVVGKAINFIEDYPSFKSTIIKVLKDVGAESFREAVDHPLANILMAAIEAWTE